MADTVPMGEDERTVTLNLPSDLVTQADSLGIDLTRLTRRALADAVARARAREKMGQRKRGGEDEDGASMYNRHVDDHGLLLQPEPRS